MQPDPLPGMIVFARMAPNEACEIAREPHHCAGCGIGDMVMDGRFRTVWPGRIWANLGLRWLVSLSWSVARRPQRSAWTRQTWAKRRAFVEKNNERVACDPKPGAVGALLFPGCCLAVCSDAVGC